MSATLELIGKINELIINPLIMLMFAVALVVFLWGLAQFLLNEGDSAGRETAKKKIIWGIIGIVIMVSVFGILNLLLPYIQKIRKNGTKSCLKK